MELGQGTYLDLDPKNQTRPAEPDYFSRTGQAQPNQRSQTGKPGLVLLVWWHHSLVVLVWMCWSGFTDLVVLVWWCRYGFTCAIVLAQFHWSGSAHPAHPGTFSHKEICAPVQ